MKNRIDSAFESEKKLLSIYFSAGHPNLNDTLNIIKNLQKSGEHMNETVSYTHLTLPTTPNL